MGKKKSRDADVLWACPKKGKSPCSYTDWQLPTVVPYCRTCKKTQGILREMKRI